MVAEGEQDRKLGLELVGLEAEVHRLMVRQILVGADQDGKALV